MSSTKDVFLLDTSALMTFIEDEEGAERVERILVREQVFVPSIALLEVCYITQQEHGQSEAEQRYALLKRTRATILWEIDEPTLLIAARFKAGFRVSLADAIIAAFAVRHHAILVHKDPEYEALAEMLILEALPYK
ncbi:MAG: PIN domain-containing protein [Chloroflexi bacterium]|nr:PIN domain-containing protein [Chloroflexota bacterium]MCL5274985.1 PIN domain-containing protein [Chloroflexota bacterium]